MDKWQELYFNLKENNIPVIEIKEDYYMIFNNKIRRYSNSVYERYNYYFETGNSIVDYKSKINKLRMSIELDYKNSDISLWEDLKEFIEGLNEEDINIANKRVDNFMQESISFRRGREGNLDGNNIWINYLIRSENDNEYNIEVKVDNSICTKLSRIKPTDILNLVVENHIDWKINIIECDSCGGIENINGNKDEWQYVKRMKIRVVK